MTRLDAPIVALAGLPPLAWAAIGVVGVALLLGAAVQRVERAVDVVAGVEEG